MRAFSVRVRGHGGPVRWGHLGATGPWRLLRAAAILFWRDNVPGMAGTIAFFGFLAVIPLALLLLAFVGNVLGNAVPPHDVRRLFHAVMPGLSQQQFLHTFWTPIRQSRVTTTVLGVVSLLFGTLGLHDSVDWAVNRIWQSPTMRPFWMAKARGFAVILWLTLFVLLSLGLSSMVSVVAGLTRVGSILPPALPALAVAFVLDVSVFAALYKFTPTVPVGVSPALKAGVVAAVLWDVSKIVFGWWALDAGTYNRVYGPLAASVIVMLWLWVSAMIFLFGASISALIQRDLQIDGAPVMQRRPLGL